MVLRIGPLLLTVQITPGLTKEMEKSLIKGGGGGVVRLSLTCGVAVGVAVDGGVVGGGGVVAGVVACAVVPAAVVGGVLSRGTGFPHGTVGAPFAVVRSGLKDFQECAP